METTSTHRQALDGKTFLVTGGAGFIGSHLCDHLLRNGAARVRVLDNLSTGSLANLENAKQFEAFEWMEGDIRDPGTCMDACNDTHYVLHQAALGSVPRSIADPALTHQTNIDGFLNMLISARDQKVRRLVYAASSSTYGDSAELPKKEDRTGRPLSPYALTKLVNEQYADVFRRTYGLDTCGLRYFNVYGPRQSPDAPYAAVIPLFIRSVLQNLPAQINGDGTQTRDFTYIENVVQANLKALLYPAPLPHQIYNVACGKRTSLNQLWEAVTTLHGSDPGISYRPSRPGDVKDSLADITRITADLGYAPGYQFEEGLELTYLHFLRASG